MSDGDVLQGYLILLYIFIGMFAILLLIFLCKRWKSINKGTFLRELGWELGYRDSSYRDSTSSQTTLWRASSTWTSKSYNYVRHSTRGSSNGVPSIVITETKVKTASSSASSSPDQLPPSSISNSNNKPTSWENLKAKRSSSGFHQIPLDVIEEEEMSNGVNPTAATVQDEQLVSVTTTTTNQIHHSPWEPHN